MGEIKRWQKIGSFVDIFRSKYGQFIGKQLFKNPFTGKEVEYIFHGEGNGVRILGLTKDNKVLAIREYQHGVDEIITHLPTGGIQDNEKIQDAAEREFFEETGYKGSKTIYLGEVFSLPRSCPTKEHCFLILGCEKAGNQELNPVEQIEVVEMPLTVWLDLIQKGEIQQEASAFTTLRALPHLGLSIRPEQKSS